MDILLGILIGMIIAMFIGWLLGLFRNRSSRLEELERLVQLLQANQKTLSDRVMKHNRAIGEIRKGK